MKYIIKYNNDDDGKKIEIKNFSDLKIFDNKIDCSNIKQGHLATCYFLEALSTLSNYGQLLYQLFPKEEINDEGYYELCLYTQGEWCKVLIDDYFLFKKRENEDGPLEFLFTQPAKGCLYSCFLEKAYAKINGSYCDINYGYQCKAFTALTGCDTMSFSNNRINNALITQLKIFLKKGYLLSGASLGHAYSILRNQNDYFVVRNPWSVLRENDILMQKKYKQINKLKFDIDILIGEFKLREKDFKQFFDGGIDVGFCLFGTRVYKIKLDQIKTIKDDKQFYFYFETYGVTNMIITLHSYNNDETAFNDMDEYSAKIELISEDDKEKEEKNLYTFNDLKKKTLQEQNSFNDFNLENVIYKGKHLGKIKLYEKFSNYENKVLTIIINKNIDIKFLGYLDKKPEKTQIEKYSSDIQYTNYLYGEHSAEIRKKFKYVNQLMKHKGFKIPDDCKGVYVELPLSNEGESVHVRDKKSGLNRCFTFNYSTKIYTYQEKDEKGNILKEEKYDYNEINDIKIHDIHQSEREHDISFEKIESERIPSKINIYKDKLEEELNNTNNFTFEEDYAKCFFNNKNYKMNLNDNELNFYLKGNILNIFNSNCCYENDIMEIELKFNEKTSHYASVKKAKEGSLCGFHIDMNVFNVFFENAKNIKRFVLRKPFRCFYRNLLEIIDNENLIYSIIEKGCCSSKHYEIISSNNEKVGIIKKDDSIGNEENIIYTISLDKRVDYKVKFLIIFGGILIIN